MTSKTRVVPTAALLLALTPGIAPAEDLEPAIEGALPELVEIYEHLHTYPELSYQERESAALVARELREAGFAVTEEVGDYGVEGRISYGVVGVMENGSGPTVMVRADMDGLPIEERTGLPYSSRGVGIADDGTEVATMHGCGHDLHMTSLVGTARALAALRDQWSGTLVMVGQPAEERGAGADAMLSDGLYERFPRPDYVLALHANAGLPAGTLGVLAGYALASVDSVDVTVRGAGGHGAYPHTTKDPVTLAAQIITNLQTIVSRQVSPFDPAVITVGSIHGGTKHNIIPDEVKLQITVRSYRPEVRRQLLDGIRRVAEDTALGAGFPPELAPIVEISEDEFTPSTYNDPELAELVREVFVARFGAERVVEPSPVMAGEDFSRYALDGEIPTQIFWLGAADPKTIEEYEREGKQLPSLHSSGFAPLPGPAIRTGVEAMSAAVLELMGRDG